MIIDIAIVMIIDIAIYLAIRHKVLPVICGNILQYIVYAIFLTCEYVCDITYCMVAILLNPRPTIYSNLNRPIYIDHCIECILYNIPPSRVHNIILIL